MIVLDASAALEVLMRRRDAAAVLAIMTAPGESLHAPHLLDLEIAHVMRRSTLSGAMDQTKALLAFSILENWPMSRYAHGDLLPRVWALRHNFSAYDAVYVALAEGLDAKLLTRDERMAAGVRAHSTLVVI